MGVVLATEAAIGIAEAVEAGSAAAEFVDTAAETGSTVAGDAIATGTETGAEAGTEAGETASNAVDTGGEAIMDSVAEKLANAVQKVLQMAKEYVEIDAVFKVANAILKSLTTDPAAQARAKKLEKLIQVLGESSTLLKKTANWLHRNSQDTTTIDHITVTIQGTVSKFLPKLGAVSIADSCMIIIYNYNHNHYRLQE